MATPSKEYSEHTAMQIDEEVRRIVNETYENVKHLLDKKKEILESVARILLEKEVIEGEELRKLINGKS